MRRWGPRGHARLRLLPLPQTHPKLEEGSGAASNVRIFGFPVPSLGSMETNELRGHCDSITMNTPVCTPVSWTRTWITVTRCFADYILMMSAFHAISPRRIKTRGVVRCPAGWVLIVFDKVEVYGAWSLILLMEMNMVSFQWSVLRTLVLILSPNSPIQVLNHRF